MMNRKNCRYVIVPAMLAMLLTASLTGCGTKEGADSMSDAETTTVTDSAGCYAFSLPDVWGEWNLQLKAGVNKLKSRYLVTVDRRFGPPSRRLSPYECRSLPFLPSYLPLLPDTLEFDTLPLLSLSERLHKLPEVDVKAKRRFTEGARAAWATEKRGQYWADVYYDCDEETERYLDEG